MRSKLILVLALGLLLAPAACGDDDCTTCVVIPIEDLEFAPALNVNLEAMTKTASGLYYQDLVIGGGEEATAGATVTVHYTGWLHDGTQFDSSVGGDPATFSLNGVIQGWSEGVPGMRVGGKRKLVIPPQLGYGQSGTGPIPGNATLVFDIDLIAIG